MLFKGNTINQLGIFLQSIHLLLSVPIFIIFKYCISKCLIPMLPLFLVSHVHPPIGTIVLSILISAYLGVCSLARYSHLSFIVPLPSLFYLKDFFSNLNLSQFQKLSTCKEQLQCLTMELPRSFKRSSYNLSLNSEKRCMFYFAFLDF